MRTPKPRHGPRRLGGLAGLGWLLLGWLLNAYAVGHLIGVVLACAWRYWTGQIPPPPPPSPLGTRLPVRFRELAWCRACARVLAPGVVRCPDHPEDDVMIVLRDEEGSTGAT